VLTYLLTTYFQIVGLLALMLMSWLVASLVLMLVPVWLGRQTFSLWLSDTPRIYELYTAALGLYTWLVNMKLNLFVRL